jgi:hypothetical protein
MRETIEQGIWEASWSLCTYLVSPSLYAPVLSNLEALQTTCVVPRKDPCEGTDGFHHWPWTISSIFSPLLSPEDAVGLKGPNPI